MSEYVTLVSGDGFEFIICRKAAQHAEAIKSKMEAENKRSLSSSSEEEKGEGEAGMGDEKHMTMMRVLLPDMSGRVLEMVAQFLCQREASGGLYTSSFSPLTNLDPTQNEDRELVMELLLAANFLSC